MSERYRVIAANDDHEPVAREQHVAAAELREETLGGEVALVDLPARAVRERPRLPAVLDLRVSDRGIDDDELGRDPPCLAQEDHALGGVEVAVEVTGDDAVEGVVGEGEREPVSLDAEPRSARVAARSRASAGCGRGP